MPDYLSIAGGKLFVAGESEGLVYKLPLTKAGDGEGAAVETFGPGPALHGVAFDLATGHAFVTRSEANTVEEFDPRTMKAIRSIPVADDPDGIFFIPDVKLMYVAGGDSEQGTLIDSATAMMECSEVIPTVNGALRRRRQCRATALEDRTETRPGMGALIACVAQNTRTTGSRRKKTIPCATRSAIGANELHGASRVRRELGREVLPPADFLVLVKIPARRRSR